MAEKEFTTDPDHPPLNRPIVGGHGYSGSPTYKSWGSMIQRATNPNNAVYSEYGGRGVTVHPPWRKFVTFLADVGERPSRDYTLDRYPNNDGNYEPGNVRWATWSEQNRNRRPRRRYFRQTHCKNGHEFTSENSYIQKGGKKAGRRHCVACRKSWRKRTS